MEGNQKFQQIVATAKELFWKYGIKRVSIEEICKEAKVSKMTFYKHFDNKIAIALYVFKDFFEEKLSIYHGIMDSDLPFVEKVEQVILLKIENAKNISQEFIIDIYKSEILEIQDYFHKTVSENIRIFYMDLKKAQERGEIRKDMNLDFVMYNLDMLIEAIMSDKVQKMYDKPEDMVIDINKFFFYGLMSSKK